MEYEGAVAHLATIVALGTWYGPGQLEKEKYLSPLLSRTNFGLLPAHVGTDANLKQDVMVASGRDNGSGWQNTLADAGMRLAVSNSHAQKRSL